MTNYKFYKYVNDVYIEILNNYFNSIEIKTFDNVFEYIDNIIISYSIIRFFNEQLYSSKNINYRIYDYCLKYKIMIKVFVNKIIEEHINLIYNNVLKNL